MHKKLIIAWLYLGILLIFLMVVIGGITRLTHSGLSIVEWDLISEAPLFPSNEEAQILFEKYKEFPEYKELNAHYSVQDFKKILFWENLHRKWGRLIGLVFIIPYLFFTLKNWISVSLHKKLLVIFLLGIFQGFLGWFMVKSGLVDKPSVSHYRLAAHLITAFLTCAYIYWVLLWYKGGEEGLVKIQSNFLALINLTLTFVIMQIVFGAFVAGLKAGSAYNTFPKMGLSWVPSEVFNQGFILDTVAGVQFVHRYMAYLVVLICVYLIWKILQSKGLKVDQKRATIAVGTVVIIQFLLGLFTLLFHVPLSLALLHQLGAFLLLLVLIKVKFEFSFTRTL